uniref:Uncharacterized protein n=1 Tax=Parascaris equorum TaxID=6256 RepID=A0A914RC41_PAREQ
MPIVEESKVNDNSKVRSMANDEQNRVNISTAKRSRRTSAAGL